MGILRIGDDDGEFLPTFGGPAVLQLIDQEADGGLGLIAVVGHGPFAHLIGEHAAHGDIEVGLVPAHADDEFNPGAGLFILDQNLRVERIVDSEAPIQCRHGRSPKRGLDGAGCPGKAGAMTGYEPSYYVASRNPAPQRPGLAGRVSTDVCVIGGGFTGLSAALELAERGFRVVLLEAERVGFGASGRNGGQMLNGLNPGVGTIEKLAGESAARLLWDMTVEATDIVRERIRRHDIACDWQPGYVHAATKPSHFTAMVEDVEMMAAKYGYDRMKVLDRAALAGQVVSDRFHGGVVDEGCGHLHPLNYALGLAAAAEAAGVALHEKSRVIEIREGDRPEVHTADGIVDCRHVILAVNAYIGKLRPRLARTIMPVATFIIATEPLGEAVMNRLMPGNACVSDSNFVLDYFRRSADHRMLFGGGASYSGRTGPHEALIMRAKMARTFPELKGVNVDYFWGGLVDITVNRLPDFGRIGDNLWYAQGFSGHGIALTNLAGRLLAEAVAGDAGRFDVFARLPHAPFPGGRLLRTPLLMAAMMWFRLRDILS